MHTQQIRAFHPLFFWSKMKIIKDTSFLMLAYTICCDSIKPVRRSLNTIDPSTLTSRSTSSIPGQTHHHSGIIIIGPDDIVYTSEMRSMKVTGEIVDGIAQVTLEQEFETSPLELLNTTSHYQLPMDGMAAVIEFSATIADRVIQAVVKEKSAARKEYYEATSNGQNAYLAEQTRADIFKISVGNLPSNQVVKVSLVYITTLESVGADTVKFVFPTDIAPRYEPRPENNTENTIEGLQSLINEGVQIQIGATSASSFVNISCATHEIEVSGELERGNGKIKVIDSDPLQRDVVILLQTNITYDPKLYIEKSIAYSNIAMMLSIVPNVTDIRLKSNSEFIFVVDRSASMEGLKMDQTRKALEQILATLPEGSLFNIIGFGSNYKSMFDESQLQSNTAAMLKANNYVRTMEADYGGTEILDPLKFVLKSRKINGFDRQVIVMTDGQVSNTADTIKFVRKFRLKARVFSLGIGSHVSRLLVQGLARSGRGTAEFVDGDSDQAVFEAVERQMNVAVTPALDDLQITWEGSNSVDITQAPYVTPPLLINKRFLMYFFLENKSPPTRVKVTARNYMSNFTIEYNINGEDDAIVLPASTTSDIIHKMAARAIIQDLEEDASKLSFDQIELNENKVTGVEEAIVRFGLKYQIASSQTSFIAVDNDNWSQTHAELEIVEDDYNYSNDGYNYGMISAQGVSGSDDDAPYISAGASGDDFDDDSSYVDLQESFEPTVTPSVTPSSGPTNISEDLDPDMLLSSGCWFNADIVIFLFIQTIFVLPVLY